MKRLITLFVIIATLGFWVSASSAHPIDLPVKWTQPPLVPTPEQPNITPYIWLSQSVTIDIPPNGPVVSNDWWCEDGTPVVALRWWGTYYTTPVAPAPSFFVWIHSNNPGPPSKPLALEESYRLTPQQLNVGEYEVNQGGYTGDPILFQYDAYLPTAFKQKANTFYWLTIAADIFTLKPTNSAWYRWEATKLLYDTSVMTIDFAFYNRLIGANELDYKDVSFEIMTPLPPSLLLLGSGLLGLGALGWRRRQEG